MGETSVLTRSYLQEELARMSRAGRTVLLITHDIDEAFLLSDRVLVMSARPGRILAEHALDAGRPRSLARPTRDGRLQGLKGKVLELLRSEVRPG